MIHYRISAPQPNNHLFEIDCFLDELNGEEAIVHLPSWRPGRYEMGNFARNIRSWKAFNEQDERLVFRKIANGQWQVQLNGASKIRIHYSYYAFQLDAGACWLDDEQWYINPVHCMLFLPDRIHEACRVRLDIPVHYKVATSLQRESEQDWLADDFHELADSPMIASANMQHASYLISGKTFHIWFQGKCQPEWNKIIGHFKSFSEEQIRMMGDFPVSVYHFLVQVLPTAFYHGVEHQKSTVLAIGPGSSLMDPKEYTDFVGVASHELFHTWNVKKIRPADLLPYNYTRENYSRLGYVYEGVTTYYGDLILERCGVYSPEQFFSEINQRLQRHFHNYGRFNLSVAESSFDTWLDGYGTAIPHRRTSIYDEGCLIALMTDLLIRIRTGGKFSLDDVMRDLYNDFGKKNIGYTEHDYFTLVENRIGEAATDFFSDFIYGTDDYEPVLRQLLSSAGCELEVKPNPAIYERWFGFKISAVDSKAVVTLVAPGSVAEKAGLSRGDELIAVNKMQVVDNFEELIRTNGRNRVSVMLSSLNGKIKELFLTPSNEEYYASYTIRKKENASAEERRLYSQWLMRDFVMEAVRT